MLLSANYVTSGRFVWTPGGIALSFGRMLQDGIVARYLAEHCPDKRLRLCAHRHELPADADVFFWSGDGTVFNRLGRFAGLGDEMAPDRRREPARLSGVAAAGRRGRDARQLVRVATGEGVVTTVWHTYGDRREVHAVAQRPPCAPHASSAASSTSPRSTRSTSRSRSPPCCCWCR